jgi:phosphatidylserine/phosphatidylglycerophosphate/cardiolipin synthase-like enzyme
MKNVYFDKDLAPAIISAIASAKTSIELAVYQISPDTPTTHARLKELWQALRGAGERGCICKAVIHEGGTILPATGAALMTKHELEKSKWQVHLWPKGKIMHAKMLIVDSTKVFIGSHNWTQGGLLMNKEASLYSDDSTDIKRAREWFLGMWDDMTKGVQ